jgi:hypothetical protein
MDIDARMTDLLNIRSMNPIDILLWLHPRVIPLENDRITVPLTEAAVMAHSILIVHMMDRILVWIGGTAKQEELDELFGTDFQGEIPEIDTTLNMNLRNLINECWDFSGRYLPVHVVRDMDKYAMRFARYLSSSGLERDEVYEKWYREMLHSCSR